ncbi:MAG: thiamine-phosphate kinase [Bacteroidetes bacterium GWA2_30_7]|nr:MAG: thiamine-phosphate kinase [Bacteroidetes bacterium GWA2_30_7]
MSKKDTITPVSDFGEFKLIKHLTENIKLKHNSTIKGVGDDAAVIEPSGKKMIITTDMLLEGIHFDLTYVPLKHLGYKAVIVNLSDVYAMNAIPKQITVSIGVSAKFSVEALKDLYDGIYMACDKYNIDLIGGDTCSSLTGLSISVTAIGEADTDKLAYRNGAKVNDLICVTGDLGGAYMGLQLLEREKMVFNSDPNMKPKFDGYDYILQRQLKPEARKDIIELFEKNKIVPTSMIDISDGLSSELLHICNQSNVSCKIYEEKIPINFATQRMANELNVEPLVSALNGGEDYELLFTVPIELHEKITELHQISIIGHISEKGEENLIITKGGTTLPIMAQGWAAFGE